MTAAQAPQAGPLHAQQLKACCSGAYEQDWVSMLLGPSFHPGGEALTRRLAVQLGLVPGMRVLDVACGNGTSALLLAREFGAAVIGLDRSELLLEKASAAARSAGVGGRLQWLRGDGERMPLEAGSVDAVICECALCTFPDKGAGVAEMTRVLAPGGRLGITDVTLDRDRLDGELSSLLAWVACLAGAETQGGYERLLGSAGLNVSATEDHRLMLEDLLDRLAPRVKALAALRIPPLENVDAGQVRDWFHRGRKAIRQGSLGYTLLVAHAPNTAD